MPPIDDDLMFHAGSSPARHVAAVIPPSPEAATDAASFEYTASHAGLLSRLSSAGDHSCQDDKHEKADVIL